MTKIAAIQMCSSHIVDENLQKAAEFIEESARNGAEIAVLPEMFAIMGTAESTKLQASEQFGPSGKIQGFIAEQAKINNIWIVAGTIPLQSEDLRKVYASTLMFNNLGECVARYDKIHLFDVCLSDTESYCESDTTEAGNEIVVIDTPFGKIGLAVCYDLRFPELFRRLFNKGAEIIMLPSAFTIPTGEAHWEILTRSRAIENFCYVIGAAQGGLHSNGRNTWGHSLIIEPWGTIVAQQNNQEEGIIYANIDLKKVHDARRAIPVAEHQRFFLMNHQ